MTTPTLHISSESLSTLLNFGRAHRLDWSATDLRTMLEHQLATPLHLALGPLAAEVAQVLTAQGESARPTMTLGELLAHPRPPLEALGLVKRFAKICRGNPEYPLPVELVMFLYYGSITVAAWRLNEAISDLGDVSIVRGLRWLCAQSWIPDEMRTVLQGGLDDLRSRAQRIDDEVSDPARGQERQP